MRISQRGATDSTSGGSPPPSPAGPAKVIADRYARFDLIPWFQRDVIRKARVLVLGAVALGNEVLKNLALFGVGRVAVCDFDVVELSNLSRALLVGDEDIGGNKAVAAVRGLRRINPAVQAVPLAVNILGDVGTSFFGEFDAVIGAVDTREARLAANRACWRMTRPFIDGGLDVLSGVVKVFRPPDSACYECTLTEEDWALLPRRNSCGLLERSAAAQGTVPTTPISASVIGAWQVQELLKILHPNVPARGLRGEAYTFDGLHFDPMLIRYPRRSDQTCSSHLTYPRVVPHPASRRELTVGELVAWAGREQGFACEYLAFDRDILGAMSCTECAMVEPVNRPDAPFRTGSHPCPACGSLNRRTDIPRRGVVPSDVPPSTTLHDLGLPPMDVVTLQGPEGNLHVTPRGDRLELLPAEF